MSKQSLPPVEQTGLFRVERNDGLVSLTENLPEPLPIDPNLPYEVVAPVTDVRERAGHMFVALNFLAQASMRHGFESARRSRYHRRELEATYGEGLDEFAKGVNFNAHRMLIAARTEFKLVYEAGNGPTRLGDEHFQRAFGNFYADYAGSANHDELERLRKRLTVVKKLTGKAPEGDTYLYDPRADVEETPANKLLLGDDEAERTTLTTPEKLGALRDDPRAGFLPASNREKNQALAFLDYMDNPRYPANVAHQLQEVFLRQKKLGQGDVTMAKRALLSLGFEFGDYFEQSAAQYVTLQKLAKSIDDCLNPNVTLGELTQNKTALYAPLVRFIDGSTLRDKGVFAAVFDPLRSHENRGPQLYDGKNKTVEDPYTAEQLRPVVQERLEQAGGIEIRELRQIVRDAASNEHKRMLFWQDRLYDSLVHGAVRQATQEVLRHNELPLRRANVS